MDMLPLCDYVVITCALTSATHHLLGCEQFKTMKNSATLVNVARALLSKQIHAAALDVTDPDPLPEDHPLKKLHNVIITPHCGTNTYETRQLVMAQSVQNMERGLLGKPMPYEVQMQ